MGHSHKQEQTVRVLICTFKTTPFGHILGPLNQRSRPGLLITSNTNKNLKNFYLRHMLCDEQILQTSRLLPAL